MVKPAARLILAAAVLTAPLAGTAQGTVEELQASARSQHLAEAVPWLRLLHADKTLTGGFRSEADAAFFLSPRGATDPQAELDADLLGFFAPAPTGSDKQHPQCQFPARFAWLNSKLQFDFSRLPLQQCPRFEEFYQRVSARAVTAIFSSYYISSPASVFGHTLLRLDRSETPLDEKHFELLDYGVNYSATIDTQNALVYAVKGLIGLYAGNFNSMPYFYKVREYNDFESRDLWEYDLALTQQQVSMVTAHVWELGSTTFPYYYISRNCSYHLIAALEAAVPELDLLSHVGKLAYPADTIKALNRVPGLVRAVRYRPSIRAQFRKRVEGLLADELNGVARLAEKPEAPLPAGLSSDRQARVLDAALDLVDLRHARGLILSTDPEAMRLKQRLLERRSGIAVQSEALLPEVPELRAPQRGHGSIRAGVAGGASSETSAFGTANLRLALHDLLDPPAGYPELSQLEFVDVQLRYQPRGRALWLDHAWLANVAAIAPMDRFVQPISWWMRAGAETLRDRGCPGCLAGSFDMAGGASLAFADEKLALFAMAEGGVAAAPRLAGLRGAPVRLAVGPSGGVRLRWGDALVLLGTARWQALPFANPHSFFELEFSGRLALPGGLALNAQIIGRPTGTEGSLGTYLYF